MSGNPSGRPKSDKRLQELARAHTEAALNVLVTCLEDPDKRVACKAAEIILDRGYGKAPQSLTVKQASIFDDIDPETLAALAEALRADIAAQAAPAGGSGGTTLQ